MVCMAIGVDAIFSGELLPILAHLAGGSLGTYIGMFRR